MDFLTSVAGGFAVALQPSNLLFCFIGCLSGTLIGVLPGLGPLTAIAFLLPVTYYIPVVPALIMLAGIYYGAMYGGSTTSILVNIPGEAASVVTCLDGYRMAQQGRAGPALGIAAIGSFIAGTFGIVVLMVMAPPLARFSLRFGPPEYATLLFLALVIIATMSSGDQLKAFLMLAAGVALGVIGADPVSGSPRFAFCFDLQDGVGMAPLAIGLFGVSEVLQNVEAVLHPEVIRASFKGLFPSWKDFKASWSAIVRGSFLGFFIGILPGGNPIVASFLSYGLEKKISKHPDQFGKGAIEGVAGPESANNSATSGAFIPLLAMGVPNNAVMALMLGAMTIHGVVPGPQLIDNAPQLFWGVIISMYIGNVMLLALNLPLVGLWVQLLRVPYRFLFPMIVVFCLLGVYAISYSRFDMLLVVLFGVVGYLLKKLDFEMAPLIMGLIIGPMIETAIRQSLMLSNGSFSIFVSRPIPLFLLVVTVLVLAHPWIKKWRFRRKPSG